MTSKQRGRDPDRIIVDRSERRKVVVQVLRRARARLTLSLFRCNDRRIFDELARAVSRGVDVQVLVTSGSRSEKRLEQLHRRLAATGATVHPYANPALKAHAKYVVADDGPALIASLNFTRKCFRKTWDALALTFDPAVVGGLIALAAADRDGAAMPQDLPERLIVGPDKARRQLTTLLHQARHSIRIIDPKPVDPALAQLLDARRREGLEVTHVSGKWIGPSRSHGKIILIDGRLAVIGSVAIAARSLDTRREVGLVVDEPGAVDVIRQLFAAVDEAAAATAAARDPAGAA